MKAIHRCDLRKIACFIFLAFCISVNAQNDFDTKLFLKMANPLVSSIARQKVILKTSAELLGSKSSLNHYFSALMVSKPKLFLKHSFHAGTGNRNLSFWIVDAIYLSEKEARSAFSELKKISGKVNDKGDKLPGLTYTNDYAIRDKNRILWLNTGCLYSEENHLKLVVAFKKSLKHTVDESLDCKCGEVECDYSAIKQ